MNTKSLKANFITDVPSAWVFKHYAKADIDSERRYTMIHSVFNKKDKTPSMSILYNHVDDVYIFNDFSTGIKGSAVTMVQKMYDISYWEACCHIVGEYNNPSVLKYEKQSFDFNGKKCKDPYKVTEVKLRSWSFSDYEYWKTFNVDSKTLEKFNVHPVFMYEMANKEDSFKMTAENVYAFYRSDGVPIKIYHPKGKRKFLMVTPYIQGHDQLTFAKSNLVITSSMKDLIVLSTFGMNAEFIAPNSESTLLDLARFSYYKRKYNKIYTLFDNDEAGIKASEAYRKEFNTTPLFLKLGDDPANLVEKYGFEKAYGHLKHITKPFNLF